MAGGKVRGVTITFRGDTTPLEKALKQVSYETKKIDQELRQVDKALKFNPKNVDLLRQKQELLSKKISETKERLDLLRETQSKVDSGEIEMSAEDYRKLQREIIETDSKLKTFNSQLSQVDKTINGMNMQAVSDKFKSVGDSLTKAGDAMKPISAAGAATVAALGALSVKSGAAADDLNTLSKVTGMSTEELQKYSVSADLVDVSVEALAKANQKLRKNMYSAANGSKSQTEAFEKLGISVTDSNGNLRDSDEVFQEAITALGKMTNETERDALAMTLMGKSATELNPLIADQGETYKQVSDTLKKYNLDYVDQETLDKANAFNDSLDTMKAIGTVALQNVGSQLAGYLAPALEKVVDLFGRFAEWLGNLNPKVLAVVGVIASVVAGIAPVLIILGKLAFAISSITGLMASAGLSIGAIATPVGIAIGVIGALIAIGVLLYKNWDKIKVYAGKFRDFIISAFNSIKTKVSGLVNGMVTYVQGRWNALKAFASTTFNSIKDKIVKPIQSAIDKVKAIVAKVKDFFPIKVGNLLSGLKLPHFKLNGKFSLNPPSVPKLDIDWYKTGGIFESPSVIGVGEAGSEAVVPLDKFWNKLDAMRGGETNIVININGADRDPRAIADEVKRMLIREVKGQSLAWR